MRNHKSKILFITILVALTVLLSACQVNLITDIKDDGSGIYTQEIGFQGDEASMAGLNSGDTDFCASQNSELPPGTSIRQETRNGDETWCIYETSFNSLNDLKDIYSLTDTSINDISNAEGTFTYDISLDLGSDSSMPTGAALYWIVNMPGKITENNADEQDGNNLKWQLKAGQVNAIRAVSETGGVNLGSNVNWYVVGGVALCLCSIVLVFIVGLVIFLLVRRKKNATKAESPAETTEA